VILDLCPRPVSQGNRSKIAEGPLLGSFLCKAELVFFHFFRNSDSLADTSAGQKIPIQPGWYIPP